MSSTLNRQNIGLNLIHQNVRGLQTKTNIFFNNLSISQIDIALITESRLCPSILDSELCDSARFDVFRRDRTTRGDAFGGGVLIACAKRFGARRRFDLEHNDLECMCISIPARTLGSLCDLSIICAYIPPNQRLPSRIQKLCEILSKLFNSHPDDHFSLAGDFNLPCIEWKQGHPINTATELLNLTAFLGLNQYNFFFNTHNNLLDLIYSNTSLIISKSPLVKEDIFHPAIDICVIDIVLLSIKRTNTKRYLYNKVDYNAVNYYFSKYDWTSLECLPLHDAIDKFYSILYESISQFVPHKTLSHTYTYPMWYTKALINIIKEKAKYHHIWKKYNNPNNYASFSKLRQRVKNVEKSCYSEYIRNSEDKIKSTPKLIWTYVKSKRNNKSAYPGVMLYKDETISNQYDICNAFNNFFCKNFISPASQYKEQSYKEVLSLNTKHKPLFTIAIYY
ncbi:unnamed protein product [Leptidea sinapis]|uniref:Endonuclease/exonuclease/phosphatase domain-containing protein n=1 Tax=Leptidea sinapis TaxID=189913 RepID=A0A5E4R2N5_9NEOP|nr:unnamed protein product [Leptidea sinapis]